MNLHNVTSKIDADSRKITPQIPSDILELKAAEQRQRLHETISNSALVSVRNWTSNLRLANMCGRPQSSEPF
jgi:hypothetical protein